MNWIYAPRSGGIRIPARVQERTRQRIVDYAQTHYAGKFNRINVHFRNQFCYFDACVEPDEPDDFDPAPLGGITRSVS